MINMHTDNSSGRCKRSIRKMILYPLLAVLSFSVMFSTAYMLILPGITLDEETAVSMQGQSSPLAQTAAPANEEAALSAVLSAETASTLTAVSSPETSASPLLSASPETSSSPETSATSEMSVSPTAVPTIEPSSTPAQTPSPEISPVPVTEYVYENDTISVTAVLTGDAVIPADAQLCVIEITPETDPARYIEFQNMLQRSAEDTSPGVSDEVGMLAFASRRET